VTRGDSLARRGNDSGLLFRCFAVRSTWISPPPSENGLLLPGWPRFPGHGGCHQWYLTRVKDRRERGRAARPRTSPSPRSGRGRVNGTKCGFGFCRIAGAWWLRAGGELRALSRRRNGGCGPRQLGRPRRPQEAPPPVPTL